MEALVNLDGLQKHRRSHKIYATAKDRVWTRLRKQEMEGVTALGWPLVVIRKPRVPETYGSFRRMSMRGE